MSLMLHLLINRHRTAYAQRRGRKPPRSRAWTTEPRTSAGPPVRLSDLLGRLPGPTTRADAAPPAPDHPGACCQPCRSPVCSPWGRPHPPTGLGCSRPDGERHHPETRRPGAFMLSHPLTWARRLPPWRPNGPRSAAGAKQPLTSDGTPEPKTAAVPPSAAVCG